MCRELARKIKLETYVVKNTPVFLQHDIGDAFYIVGEGAVEMVLGDYLNPKEAKIVHACYAGEEFGEIALHNDNCKRTYVKRLYSHILSLDDSEQIFTYDFFFLYNF